MEVREPADEFSATLAEERPQTRNLRVLLSPSILGTQGAGWLIFLCMWLPVNRGCGGTINRPIEQIRFSGSLSISDWLGNVWFLGSYANGLVAACLLALSAVWCSERLWWRSFVVQFASALFLCILALTLSLLRNSQPRYLVESALVWLPPLLLSIGWISAAIRRNHRQVAWARLQHSWTIVGLFTLQVQCLFSTTLLYGYWLTVFGFALQIFYVEVARLRMTHDLWDASQPVGKLQFSMRNLFFWMTFTAIALGYYFALGPAIDWLVPPS
jgi:hypothetical protein